MFVASGSQLCILFVNTVFFVFVKITCMGLTFIAYQYEGDNLCPFRLLPFRLTRLAHVPFRLYLNVIFMDDGKFVNTICNVKLAITVTIPPTCWDSQKC